MRPIDKRSAVVTRVVRRGRRRTHTLVERAHRNTDLIGEHRDQQPDDKPAWATGSGRRHVRVAAGSGVGTAVRGTAEYVFRPRRRNVSAVTACLDD